MGQKYIDPERERRVEAETQHQMEELRSHCYETLPVVASCSEGMSYNILNCEVKDPQKVSMLEKKEHRNVDRKRQTNQRVEEWKVFFLISTHLFFILSCFVTSRW